MHLKLILMSFTLLVQCQYSNSVLACWAIDHCLECSNPSVCISCEDYYGLNANQTCSECNYAGHCSYCYFNANQCEYCFPGYEPNSNGDGSCSESPPCTAVENCQICMTPPKCDRCKDGYVIGPSSESCTPSSASCPDHCLDCSNPRVCNSCEDFYGLNVNQTCSACNYTGHCSYCYKNISHCEICDPGYEPSSNGDGSCSESAPCATIENCQICTIPQKCDKCKDGYYSPDSTSCIPNPSITLTTAEATEVNAATTQVASTIAATTTMVASTFSTTTTKISSSIAASSTSNITVPFTLYPPSSIEVPSTIAASTIKISSTTTSIIFLTTTSFTMTVPSTIAAFTTTVSSIISYSTIEVSSTTASSTITVASTIATTTTTIASTIAGASTIATSTTIVSSTTATSTIKVSYAVVSTILSSIILASTTTAKQNVTVTQLPPGVNIPVLVGSVIGVIMGAAITVVLLCIFSKSSPLNRPYAFG